MDDSLCNQASHNKQTGTQVRWEVSSVLLETPELTTLSCVPHLVLRLSINSAHEDQPLLVLSAPFGRSWHTELFRNVCKIQRNELLPKSLSFIFLYAPLHSVYNKES